MAALADNGPGAVSVDEALLPELKGPAMAALAVGAAIAGSYVATSDKLNPSAPAPLEGSSVVAGDPATTRDAVSARGA